MAQTFRQVRHRVALLHTRLMLVLLIRYKQALQSASSLQRAAKDAAGKLREQQNDFSSHKQSIQGSIKKLRRAQFKLTA